MNHISELSWGSITVIIDGEAHLFKDCKIWADGVRNWDWSETGTRHTPGIQPADVEELIENGSRVIVLTRGMWKRLRVAPETELFLKDAGITYYIEKTREGVALFNRLSSEGKLVGGLFHSTC